MRFGKARTNRSSKRSVFRQGCFVFSTINTYIKHTRNSATRRRSGAGVIFFLLQKTCSARSHRKPRDQETLGFQGGKMSHTTTAHGHSTYYGISVLGPRPQTCIQRLIVSEKCLPRVCYARRQLLQRVRTWFFLCSLLRFWDCSFVIFQTVKMGLSCGFWTLGGLSDCSLV